MKLSIVMPVLDEAPGIAAALQALEPLRVRGHEVIVVDGGSTDGTQAIATALADRVVAAPRGRATQMNRGAALAAGEAFVFLHADTCLPADADRLVAAALAGGERDWGRFDVRIEGRAPLLALVGWCMNLRSRLTGIATGDQAIFATRRAFDRIGGFPEIALMEDIAFSRRAKRLSAPACLRAAALTSGRRWDRHGVVRTVLFMWRLRLAFFFGARPDDLARQYAARS